MKARRLFILALALLLAVALMTTALVACNPDKGEDTTGESPDAGENPSKGDVIFTEDATLAGIKAALDAAENVTYKYYGSAGDFEYDYIYRFARDCVTAEAVEKYEGTEQRAIYYAVLKDGVFYDVACEDGQWSVDKNLASNTDADSLPSGLFDEYVFTVPFALEEVDGKLQPKNSAGVLSLDGDSATLIFETKADGVTVQTEAYSLSLVNATEVTVPADVLERINAADWADEVRYNGIDYNKTLTGASGEETTVYVYDDKNLPLEVTPETTINGFPVIAESELAQQPAGDVIFMEDATLAGIKAAMNTSVSYTYEYTATFDNENEPYCREVYYITENVARVLCEERDLESGEWSVVYEEYLVEHSGGFFRVYAEQGNWAAEKASTTCEQLRATMYDGVLGCLIESHGAIVPDESVLKNGTHYVEGSARVSLEGARLQLSITYWNRETSPVSSTERYVLRGVNTTTVEAPAGIMEAIEVYLKGDVIFTEDATLAGIKAALDAAENVTYKYYGSAGDFEYDYIYRFARDCVVAEAVENYDGQERRAIYYAVLKDGVFYDVACEDGQWSVDKNLASNTDADSLPSGLFDEYVFTVPFALEEADGKLQPKDGAGVLSLDGDSVTLTFEKKEDGVTVQTEAYSLSLVNATEVTVPADVLERINAADWADEVRYNGIDYTKTLTGASGEETTVYVYDDKNLPLEVTPETTINGFPVIAESELAQQSAGDVIFTEGATSDEMIAAVDAAESYTYVHTLTRDGESEPYKIETTYVTTDAIKLVGEEMDDESGEMKVTSEGYIVEYSGECFTVTLQEGNLFVENSLIGDIALFMRVFAGLMDCLVTRDGVITVDESDLVGDDFAINYVEGSASVSLEGYRLQVQFYSTDDDGTYITETYIYEGVNATTVEVPTEVADAVEAAYATL